MQVNWDVILLIEFGYLTQPDLALIHCFDGTNEVSREKCYAQLT